MEAPEIDDILVQCIDRLWNKYDDDNSGYLDKSETKVFIRESLYGETGEMDEDILTEKQFNACFEIFDSDGSGTVSKAEMLYFIKIITGFDEE